MSWDPIGGYGPGGVNQPVHKLEWKPDEICWVATYEDRGTAVVVRQFNKCKEADRRAGKTGIAYVEVKFLNSDELLTVRPSLLYAADPLDGIADIAE